MTANSGQDSGNPLIVIGDQIQPKFHLISPLQYLRNANSYLAETEHIQYMVCSDSANVALALRKHLTEEQHSLPQLFTRIEKSLGDKPGMNTDQALDDIISQKIFEDLVSIPNRLGTSESLWELIEFKAYFNLAYITAPKIKNVSIAFLQQTS